MYKLFFLLTHTAWAVSQATTVGYAEVAGVRASADAVAVLPIPCPHSRLPLSFQNSACPEEIDFQAIFDTILLMYHADVRGFKSCVVHRVVLSVGVRAEPPPTLSRYSIAPF